MRTTKTPRSNTKMSKATSETIPLADFTITWKPVPFFRDGNDPQSLTLTGKDLPIALQVLAMLSPEGNWSKLGDPEDIALDVLGQASPAVHPPLNAHGTRGSDCPVCGAAIIGSSVQCDRCDAQPHEECYFGRVATLEEWQDYIRNVNGGPEDYAPDVVYAQCRAKGERA